MVHLAAKIFAVGPRKRKKEFEEFPYKFILSVLDSNDIIKGL